MRFGDVPKDDARGSILARTIKLSRGNLKKRNTGLHEVRTALRIHVLNGYGRKSGIR
jgi:hypothetical protein